MGAGVNFVVAASVSNYWPGAVWVGFKDSRFRVLLFGPTASSSGNNDPALQFQSPKARRLGHPKLHFAKLGWPFNKSL